MSAPARTLPAPAEPGSTGAAPTALTVTLTPRARRDAIDVGAVVRERFGDALDGYRKAAYCSLHTTAGYLEQGLAARLEHRDDRLAPFIRAFSGLFPPDADYRHDRLEERRELSPEQRTLEPKNADSHLTFIAAGLRNCVTYLHRPGEPVYFVDLDGVNGETARTRQTTVLGYNREQVVARATCEVAVSRHPIDSVNLADPRQGQPRSRKRALVIADTRVTRHPVPRQPPTSDDGSFIDEFGPVKVIDAEPREQVASEGHGVEVDQTNGLRECHRRAPPRQLLQDVIAQRQRSDVTGGQLPVVGEP